MPWRVFGWVPRTEWVWTRRGWRRLTLIATPGGSFQSVSGCWVWAISSHWSQLRVSGQSLGGHWMGPGWGRKRITWWPPSPGMEMWMRPTSMGWAGPCFLKQVRFSPSPLSGPEAACRVMGRTRNGPRPALGGGSVAGGVVVVVSVGGGLDGVVLGVVVASAPSSRWRRGRWRGVALSGDAWTG